MGSGPARDSRLEVTPQQLEEALRRPTAPFVLDVRGPDEFERGHIPQARLIPLPDVLDRLGQIPRTRRVVCVCQVGERSARAAAQLRAVGYDAANLTGGMDAWTGPVVRGASPRG
jgi:rhodanese-related sulfurtransferase